jgi:hypothetical protein
MDLDSLKQSLESAKGQAKERNIGFSQGGAFLGAAIGILASLAVCAKSIAYRRPGDDSFSLFLNIFVWGFYGLVGGVIMGFIVGKMTETPKE